MDVSTYPPLATPADLAGFPGAPFTADIIAAASAGIRRRAGWHIAPSATETIVLDTRGGPFLLLPTLHLTEVTEVRDVTEDAPVVMDGWRFNRGGDLYRRRGWAPDFQSVEVDIKHGFTATPADLFAAIAQVAQAIKINTSVRQETAGAESVAYAIALADAAAASATPARLVLPPSFGAFNPRVIQTTLVTPFPTPIGIIP